MASQTADEESSTSVVKNTNIQQSDGSQEKLSHEKAERLKHPSEADVTTDNQMFSCPQCSASFAKSRSLKQHIHVKHVIAGNHFPCSLCNLSFKKEGWLERHVRVAHRAKMNNGSLEAGPADSSSLDLFQCKQCEASFASSSSLKKHMVKHKDTGGQVFSCDKCAASYPTSRSLLKHMVKHNDKRPFLCGECGRSFISKGFLAYHIRVHRRGAKPYLCSFCAASFSQQDSLNVHLRTHTGERPYVCNVCGAAHGNRGNLRSHMMTHSNEKKLVCQDCGASFKHHRSWTRHKLGHLSKKPFPCDLCDASFKDAKRLQIHVQTHTGVKPHTCSECGISYHWPENLKRHMKKHGIDISRTSSKKKHEYISPVNVMQATASTVSEPRFGDKEFSLKDWAPPVVFMTENVTYNTTSDNISQWTTTRGDDRCHVTSSSDSTWHLAGSAVDRNNYVAHEGDGTGQVAATMHAVTRNMSSASDSTHIVTSGRNDGTQHATSPKFDSKSCISVHFEKDSTHCLTASHDSACIVTSGTSESTQYVTTPEVDDKDCVTVDFENDSTHAVTAPHNSTHAVTSGVSDSTQYVTASINSTHCVTYNSTHCVGLVGSSTHQVTPPEGSERCVRPAVDSELYTTETKDEQEDFASPSDDGANISLTEPMSVGETTYGVETEHCSIHADCSSLDSKLPPCDWALPTSAGDSKEHVTDIVNKTMPVETLGADHENLSETSESSIHWAAKPYEKRAKRARRKRASSKLTARNDSQQGTVCDAADQTGYSEQYATSSTLSRVLRKRAEEESDVKREHLFLCDQCTASFLTTEKLKQHKLEHNDRRPFSCDACHVTFKAKGWYQRHIRTCRHRPKLSPDVQYDLSAPHRSRKSHLSVKVEEKDQVTASDHSVSDRDGDACVLDTDNFQSDSETVPEESEKSFACFRCEASFKSLSSLKKHMVKHKDTKGQVFLCDQCPASYTTSRSLKKHMIRHNDKRPFPCHECGRSFISKGFLAYHIRIHRRGAKPYLCSFCAASFSQQDSLNVHLRTHTGEKPYVCTICGAAHGSRGNLRSHMMTHSSEKTLFCQDCGASFKHYRSWTRHKLGHLSKKPFPCDLCDASFKDAKRLQIHVQTHTGVKPHTCSECGISYHWPENLKRHMKKHDTV